MTLGLKIPRSCVEDQLSDARDYNSKLNDLLSKLQSNYTKGTKLIYLDIYSTMVDMINRPASYGERPTHLPSIHLFIGIAGHSFTLVDFDFDLIILGFNMTLNGCCGTGLFEFGTLCNTSTPTCDDASKYVFFDSVHPSEAGYKHVSETIYNTLVKMLT